MAFCRIPEEELKAHATRLEEELRADPTKAHRVVVIMGYLTMIYESGHEDGEADGKLRAEI